MTLPPRVPIRRRVVQEMVATVEIQVEHRGETRCPECGVLCPGYDSRHRRWRHLDAMQHQTRVVAEVPRVR